MRYLVLLFLSFCASSAFAAECRIVEFSLLVNDLGQRVVQLPLEPNLAVQEVTYTTSTSSAAFNANTSIVRIRCDALAYYKFSTVTEDTSATATDASIPADTTLDLGVKKGENYKVEFYDGTS